MIVKDVILEDDSPLFATVFLGANDCSTDPRQHVPLEEYSRNLTAIVQHLQGYYVSVVCAA